MRFSYAVYSLPLQFKSQEPEVTVVPFLVQLLRLLSYHVIAHWNPQLCLPPDKTAIGLDLLPKVIAFTAINKERNTAFNVGPNNAEMEILFWKLFLHLMINIMDFLRHNILILVSIINISIVSLFCSYRKHVEMCGSSLIDSAVPLHEFFGSPPH